MVGDDANRVDADVIYPAVGEGGDEVECVSFTLSWTNDVLDEVERCQNFRQSHRLWVVHIINVNVEITAYDDWTAVDEDGLNDRSHFVTELTVRM